MHLYIYIYMFAGRGLNNKYVVCGFDAKQAH